MASSSGFGSTEFFRSIHTASVPLHGCFFGAGARSYSLSGFAGRTRKSPASFGMGVRETGEGSRTSHSLKEKGLGSSVHPRTRFPSNIHTNLFLLTSHPNPNPNPNPYPRVQFPQRTTLSRFLLHCPEVGPSRLLCRRDFPAGCWRDGAIWFHGARCFRHQRWLRPSSYLCPSRFLCHADSPASGSR
jgi:hypothetical protein